jgi:oligoendopeptidase F
MAFSLQQLSTQMLLLPSTLAFASRSLHSRSPLLHHGGSLASTGAATNPAAASFIDRINNDYEGLHKSFEQQFWGTKMALASKDYSTEELTRTKREMEDFLASEEKLATTRQLLADGGLSDRDAMTLKLFERTFGCYIMESAEAREFRLEATKIEGDLESSRNNMALGAELPGQGYVEMSSVGLRSKMSVDSNEEVRKACWESLRGIGDFVLANGFIELVKARNAMAKALGYEDYYDYKVTQAEGFGKRDLFDILDKLEEDTRPLMEQARKDLQAIKGESALEPWNTGYLVAGDVTSKLDPYFPFEKSVEAWGRSFSALGIEYKGATMDLDLLDRKRKYSNGFCHWPQPGEPFEATLAMMTRVQ